jgi:HD-GYP domain-containing protein (c-di-GMP phosphodiesterase class II)
MEAFMQVMESTIAARDPYTVGHQRRVCQIACAIGKEMGLSQDQNRDLRIACTLHDLGKIAIPTGILSRPGKIAPLEFELIKTHPQVAYDILKPINLPGNTAEIILQHHERLDGSGYPRGLKGDDILLEARILAVADVVEAMCSHRPYRPALGLSDALEEVSRHQGILYDADVVKSCLKIYGPEQADPDAVIAAILPQVAAIPQPLPPLDSVARLSHISPSPRVKSRNWTRLLSQNFNSWVRAGTVSIMGFLVMISLRGY